jgi:hypothetical protein
MNDSIVNGTTGRREFISMLSAATAAGLLGTTGAGRAFAASGGLSVTKTVSGLPEISLGEHKISRLISGSNPILGYSYMGPHADQAMKEYFTRERVIEFHKNCEQAGITSHQMSYREDDPIHQMPGTGSKRKLICLLSAREQIQSAAEITKAIGLSHHGGVTDRLFAQGKYEVVHDFVKAVKDKGVLAGVSAHNPDCIKRIADEGWEVDFFMTCFYFLTRKTFGLDTSTSTLEISYPFFKDDPKVMTQVIRQVKQPCLAFKILGAGRLCSSQETVKEAFKFAFDNIKPTDGVIVGMFPRSFDQIGANSGYAREIVNT